MVTRRARMILVCIGLLLVLAALALLIYSLAPLPVENLQATLAPTLFSPPQGAP
jgi:hypothetical protein